MLHVCAPSLPECSPRIPSSNVALAGGSKVTELQEVDALKGSEPEIGLDQFLELCIPESFHQRRTFWKFLDTESDKGGWLTTDVSLEGLEVGGRGGVSRRGFIDIKNYCV